MTLEEYKSKVRANHDHRVYQAESVWQAAKNGKNKGETWKEHAADWPDAEFSALYYAGLRAANETTKTEVVA